MTLGRTACLVCRRPDGWEGRASVRYRLGAVTAARTATAPGLEEGVLAGKNSFTGLQEGMTAGEDSYLGCSRRQLGETDYLDCKRV
jgi:hypothetical protein